MVTKHNQAYNQASQKIDDVYKYSYSKSMFIVHNTEPHSSIDDMSRFYSVPQEFTEACAIVGTPDDIKNLGVYVTAIGLQAVQCGLCSPEKLADLLEDLTVKSDEPTIVLRRSLPTLYMLSENYRELAQERRDQLIVNGIEGKMGAQAIAEEMAVVNFANDSLLYPVTTPHFNSAGLLVIFESEGPQVDCVRIDERNENGYEDPELEFIKSVAVTHGATQIALLSDRTTWLHSEKVEHDSVGNLDDKGNYVPFVTILNNEHPVRQLA